MMTKITKFLKIAVCIASLQIASSVNAQTWPPAGMLGNGTQKNPWQIDNIKHLIDLAAFVNAGNGPKTSGEYYKLMGDLDFKKHFPQLLYNWEPIGNNIVKDAIFQGNFDGNGKVIANFYCNRSDYFIGFFGYILGANIHNLGIEVCDIIDGHWVGGLVGQAVKSTIENCYTTGTVTGSGRVGGLIGISDNSTISNCYANCEVSGVRYIGGLVGVNFGSIKTSYAAGNITATGYIAGGFVSYNNNQIFDCYATGNVTGGSANHGSFAGMNFGSITYCYATGAVIGYGFGPIGLFAGYNYDTLRNCVAANSTGCWNCIEEVYPSTVSNNYAFNAMVVNPYGGDCGIDASWATLTSFNFYNSNSNWHNNIPWSIDNIANPNKSWIICNDNMLPRLQWEEIECDTVSEPCAQFQDGSINAPYLICTVQDLVDLATLTNTGGGNATMGKYWKMMNDLDLIGMNWNPIGNSSNYFQGYFDGNNKVIANLTINKTTTSYIGLFGNISNAEIRNLEIRLCNISGNECIGALVGSVSGISTIENCHVTDCVIVGFRRVGGLIGEVDCDSNVNINNCGSKGSVTGTEDAVGGLIGWLFYTISNISNCYSICEVNGAHVGGFIGIAYNFGSIEKNHASGNIQCLYSAAGLIDDLYAGDITDCYATANITSLGGSSYVSIGGLIGANFNNITNCYATVNITNIDTYASYLGGLVGNNINQGFIYNCYATGNIFNNGDSGYCIGGFVGINYANINYCYTSCNISATKGISYIGGLAGYVYTSGTVRNCVAANNSISGGTSNVNRIAGNFVLGSSTLSNNYAFDNMIIAPSFGVAGISTPMDTLKSFNFYDTGSNWYYDKPWSIDDKPNSSVIWGICDGKTLPFFQWRGFYCKKSPAKSGNNEEDSLTTENEKSTFSIYPNPAENHITISSEGDFHTVEIVDVFGRIIHSQVNQRNSITLDISKYSTGMYFVRIISNEGVSAQKFVKK